ncbi:right-handed parallel beta-helix repeat-containing protein [Pelagicoccus mobilis]|nr:right-handed parallel beta-helix repeat-containing protein [Pelagicoccus mobilis]
MLRVLLLFIAAVQAAFATTYYVSPDGDDRNAGTSEEEPFRVVQRAVNEMNAGDTLVVLDGVYSGRLNLKSGITIEAKTPRKVFFSGLEHLNSRFEKYAEGIFRAKFNGQPKQVLYNDQPLAWACWPNLRWAENWVREKKWAAAGDGTGPGVLTSEAFEEIAGLNLAGAYCFIRYGKGNSCYSRTVESFDGRTLVWNDDDFYEQKFTGEDGRRGSEDALRTLKESHVWHPNKSKFFLAGALDLLDAPGEWFVEDGYLYLYSPDGTNPNDAVILTKAYDFCIDQDEGLNDVILDGIDFLGCSVRLSSNANAGIAFKNVHFSYIGAELLYVDRVKGGEIDKPIEVAGSNISIERCLFAGGQNSALKLTGSDITVENCVFLENNRHANFESAPLYLEARGTFQLNRNTFFNNCSDAVKIRAKIEEMDTVPVVSYNNIFNAGIFNSDVSGVYMPIQSQHFTEFHHNWMHNVHGNALRLDLGGKELTIHHNVFWASKRGLNIEGYGQFNIYNNTSVHNEVADALTRNVLNHVGMSDASLDTTFPPIDDWNVLNNLIEKLEDRVGPREKKELAKQLKAKRVHPERAAMRSAAIPIVDRGSIQGNLTGERRDLFTGGELSELNLVPSDLGIRGGATQSEALEIQGVAALDSFRGAYDVGSDYWYPGSDWMPYGLPVLKTMAESERFAKKYRTKSIVPNINVKNLPLGRLDD